MAAAQPLEIRPGVAAVVRNDRGEILLHRRVVGGAWAPPSGFVEPGERLTAAITRELAEEAALSVRVARLVGIYSDPQYQVVAYPDGRRIHFVTCLFECEVMSGDLRGSEEATAWGWFVPSELPDDLLEYATTWLDDAFANDPSVRVR